MASVAPAPTPAYSTTLCTTLPSEAAPAPRNLSKINEKTQKANERHIWNSKRGHSDMLPFVCSVCTSIGWDNQVFESQKRHFARVFLRFCLCPHDM